MAVTKGGLLKPTKEQLASLIRLRSSDDWPKIRLWLEDSLKGLGGNVFAEDHMARWAQGQGQNIISLIFHVEQSNELLETFKKTEKSAVDIDLEKFL